MKRKPSALQQLRDEMVRAIGTPVKDCHCGACNTLRKVYRIIAKRRGRK